VRAINSPKFTIASQILRRVFAIYLILAIFLTIMHLFIQYQDTRRVVSEELDITHSMVAPGLAKALWDYNHGQVEKTLRGMLLLPYIESVLLTDDSGKQFSFGKKFITHGLNTHLQGIQIRSSAPLIHKIITIGTVQKKNTGNLIIFGDKHVLYHRLKTSFSLVIINAIIKTTALWFIFLWIGRLMLSKPLQKLTSETQNINMSRLKTVEVDIGRNKENELDILQDAFNQMILRLHQSHSQQQESFNELVDLKKSLEIKIESRTKELQINNEILSVEVREHRLAKEKIAEKEQELRHLIEHNNIVGWKYDIENSRFTYVSPHAKVLFGYPLDEWKNKNFWEEHIYSEDKQTTIEHCHSQSMLGENYAFDYRMVKSNGDLIWLKDIVSVEMDTNNKPITLSGFFIDIDERKKANIKLEEQNKLIVQQSVELNKVINEVILANKAKSIFLANMSHEIRTPMNSIIGMTRFALKTDLDDKQKNYISKAYLSAENLLGIINDILDFSKIELGKLDIEKTDFHLEDILEDVNNLISMKASEKNIHLTFCNTENLPTALIGDPLRLRQILINLGNNAVKFTLESGTVDFNVNLREENDEDVELHFSISDTGIGITKEQQDKIFKSFSQADNSISREYGGTGLGLAISKSLTELMGGKIWLESEIKKGSVFHFIIKLKKQKGDFSKPKNIYTIEQTSIDDESLNKLRGAKILLVEDNEINQEVVVILLSEYDINVSIANNGQEALDILDYEYFDGVLMDCQMPVMDGYKASRKIREKKIFNDLPIIAMTANAMKNDINKCLDAGMNDHIAKPLNPEIVFTTMAKWISSSHNSKDITIIHNE
jgi:PAS domain S-box-containing protein